MAKGKLIVLEGIDGSGKSAHYRRICEKFKRDGVAYDHIVFPRYDKDSSALIRMYLSGQFGSHPNDVNAYTNGAVHIDVGFSSSGEAVAIARPDGTLVSSFAYPMQLDDISYGYVEVNGELALRYFRTPTPGAPNDTEGFEGPTAPIVFSEAHGYKTAPFALALSCPDDPAAEIRYTLDGKAPSSASARYTQPLAISSTTVVRAAAVNPAAIIQREGVASYIFLDAMRYGMRTDLVSDPVARAKMLNGFTNSIVTISIAIDPSNLFNASTGIYVNVSGRGLAWERQGMVEQIDPVNGTVNEFFAPMGLRIRGAASRQAGYPKHSLRLFFRSEYGMKRVEFPFFGDEGASSFRRMDLRCSQNYSWANNPTEAWGWMRDAFVTETFERDAQRDVGQPYTRSRYCNLFINGVYWGLYQTQERADDHFASTYLGGESEDYDAYNVNELNSGSDDARQALYSQMIAGFTSNAAYLRALGCNPDGTRNPDYPVYIDVTNLILRTQIGHYCADGDSPCSIWSRMPNNYFALSAGLLGRHGDALSVNLAVDWRAWTFAFSYDANLSTLAEASHTLGAFEIGVIYRIGKKDNTKRALPCPII